jgi:hypothetical protein
MGTRSLTQVYEHGKAVVCMYRQFDGYPTGHGAELSQFLNQFAAITNGIAVGETRKTANGMGCLAAQMIGHFKTEAGGFYLYPIDSQDVGEEYDYHIHNDKVVVNDSYTKENLFTGSWDAFAKFCTKEAVAE